jgi:hypothetical protein
MNKGGTKRKNERRDELSKRNEKRKKREPVKSSTFSHSSTFPGHFVFAVSSTEAASKSLKKCSRNIIFKEHRIVLSGFKLFEKNRDDNTDDQ